MKDKKYTIWVYCYGEGWTPQDKMNMQEVVEYIHSGESYGKLRITTDVEITIN